MPPEFVWCIGNVSDCAYFSSQQVNVILSKYLIKQVFKILAQFIVLAYSMRKISSGPLMNVTHNVKY